MSDHEYHPLLDTLRLYAGWLFALLFVVFSVGIFQQTRELPWEFPLLDEWVASPLILQVSLLTFLFLLLSTVHRLVGRGMWKGLALAIIGFALFAFFRANM